MLPTNVMSFMKKMVTTEPTSAANTDTADTGTFGKLRQTLSSSLMTAQDKVTKMTPRPSLIPEPETTPPEPPPNTTTTTQATNASSKPEPGKPPNRTGTCRVCLKVFKPEDFIRTCAECTQKVCEDCASYSKIDENEDQSTWKCSICRRKLQSRTMIAPQDSTDSLLDVPVLEALQRRHSDVRIGGSRLGLDTTGTGGSGLAPPRSPELRRHSDVSPASLKELEKLKGSSNSTSRADLEWGPRSRQGRSPPRRGSEIIGDHIESRGSISASEASTTIANVPPSQRSRRMSRIVHRQHSYDDDLKPGAGDSGTRPASTGTAETGLGLPAPMPRRASAYDVYAPGVLAAAQAGIKSSEPAPEPVRTRRSSFRALPGDDHHIKDKKESPVNVVEPPTTLGIEEDRRTRRRGSQLPDISALRNMPTTTLTPAVHEDKDMPRRQQSIDGEAIKIVIHDVDSQVATKRRVLLRRDQTDKAHRTRGFGMRVVGGKPGIDGRLFANIVWTVPGGPAEKACLQKGDKVLEWGGLSLMDRSFEEVCAIMDQTTGDTLELVVEQTNDMRMCDLFEDQIMQPSRKSSDAMIGLQIDSDNEKTAPSSPTRRKLPKTPEQLAREKQVSGRIQLQVWYHDERKELVVAVLAGDDLAPRDDTLGFGGMPEAYAKLRLLPVSNDQIILKTDVSSASQNPIWNANLTFPNIAGEELLNRGIEVTLWDMCPHSEPVFLGECSVDIEKAFIDDRAVWYRLEDPKQLRGAPPGKSPFASPRGSLAGDVKSMRRNDFGNQRSVSDDLDSIGECTSLLHPDYAWTVGGGSRRGSSQSEQLEVEVYQLGRDFSRSLPGSRRSSFQSAQQDSKDQSEGDSPPVVINYHRERRRSSCTKMLRDPDEILRSLKAVKGELGRTMSFSTSSDKRSRRSSAVSTCSRKNSIFDFSDHKHTQDEEEEESSSDNDESEMKLGPGQIQPRGFRITAGRHGAIKLGLHVLKGHLEVDVIRAKNICSKECENPPDTYVKCYLREGEKWLQKRKTRVTRRSIRPRYRQTLRYNATEVLGRTLVVMLWERQGGFEHNQGLGGAEIALDTLHLTRANSGWYPLYPMNSLGSDSNDSP